MKQRMIRFRIMLTILLFVSMPVVFGAYIPGGAHDQQYPFAAMKVQQATGILRDPPLSRTYEGKTQTVIIEVLKAMLLPSLAVPSGEQKIYAGAMFSFAVIATDLNLPPLPIILSASGLPAGATFNSDTGVLTWTPSVTQTGRYVISFAASNGLSGATTGRVVVTVSGSLLGTASLSTVPDWTMMWVLPLSIGLVIGIVPSTVLL